MGAPEVQAPGQDWLAIVSRPTLAEFAGAFVDTPTLEASVLANPVMGVAAVRAFFDATQTMYDAIAFTGEHRGPTRTCLEWEGEYLGRPVSGATILITGSGDLIAHVRLFHLPLDQLNAFAADVQHRLNAGIQGESSCE